MINQENPDYLQNQLITYIGNKRALLPFIGQAVNIIQADLGKQKISCLDLFSGSGIVARYLKQFASSVTVNDLEEYSAIINQCYLSDLEDEQKVELKTLYNSLMKKLNQKMEALFPGKADLPCAKKAFPGFISELYAPKDLNNIQKSDRCFYTPYNAAYIDLCRQLISSEIPEKYQPFFIAPLLSEASIHANTAGIFKGFYKNSSTGIGQFGGNGKNALSRITGKISLPFPVFSNFSCPHKIFNQNANELVESDSLYELCKAENSKESAAFDVAYFDPPYNQHPYGSNYFMLNLIANYQRPDSEKISRVSGIPKGWNRSAYNRKKIAAQTFAGLVEKVRAKYVLISFNSEGFIPKNEMTELLSKIGKVQILESQYNTFRGSRNLGNREIHVKEYLYLVKKE